ncbi:MAG: hypothetical protein LAO19_13215 [Acidobacteriia bacterium]|nr:hypothetical protein [Terriglobia bacterium]
MKLKWIALMMVILLASTISAHPRKGHMLYFSLPILVNGVQVPAGIYSVSLETHDSTALVTISKDGKFVAGSKGNWVKQGEKFADNAVLLRVNSDGSRSLVELRLSGTKETIVFTDPVINVDSLKSAHPKSSDD